MIYLLVILLSGTTPTEPADGWAEGLYSTKYYEHSTIASCEAQRHRMITNTAHPRKLISNCGTERDRATFTFHGTGAKAPTAKPPVYDEKPKPPSAPKPRTDWESAA